MTRRLSSHDWIARFAVRAMNLHSDLSWQRAAARGVVAFTHFGELQPEVAAVIDAGTRRHHMPALARMRA